MIGKYSLRIKLDDFIKKDCEDKILSILEKLQSSTPAIVSLILWMDDDFVGNLKEVIDSIQGARHSKTNIIQKSTIKESDFIWWDIRSRNELDAFKSTFRFQYQYSNESQLLDGVKEFSDAIKFFGNKPPKEKKTGSMVRKQKRNDL